jgi:hypothetical protein
VVRAPRMEWFGVSGSAARLEYAGKAPGRMAADGGWTGPWMPVKRAGAEGTTMQELRFVAVSEDGRYAVLAVPGRSARFTLPIDERLRAVALGQTSRLAQYEIEVESPLRPKEIQARIRAGETVEEIADAAGIAIERVRWFEGPVLAERAYIAQQAQTAAIRRQGDAAPSTPGPRLGEVVAERLTGFGVDPEDAQWDAKKRGDGSWQVQLTFITGGRLHVAEWVFDSRRRHVQPADDNAARMSLPGAEPLQPAPPPPGEATVTHLAPRLGAASGRGAAPGAPAGSGFGGSGFGGSVFGPVALGNGGSGNGGALGGNGGGLGAGGGGRARHERSGSGSGSGSGRPGVSEPVSPTPSPAAAPVPAASPPAASAAAGSAGAGGSTRAGSDEPYLGEAERQPLPRHAVPEPAPAYVRTDNGYASVPESPVPTEASAAEVTHSPAAMSPTASAPRGPAAAPAEAPVALSSAQTEPAGEQAGRPGKKAARGKRSSVPSWDEIMFGSTRQRD